MNTNNEIMYIYNLPHQERRELCRILDQNDSWEELGGTYMNFDVMTLRDIRRGMYKGCSPTEELLTLWGHQNHTVAELFVLLSRMHHYQSMITLKRFVDSKYHKLIKDGEQNLSRLIQNLGGSKSGPCDKDLGIAEKNFDNSRKIINVAGEHMIAQEPIQQHFVTPRMPSTLISREDNENINVSRNDYPRNNNLQTNGRIGNISPVSQSAGAIPQIPYHELQAATNNWSSHTILGKGGFGTVFKGTWKCTLVAIKRIENKEDSPESHSIQLKQSITELHCLNAYRHDNILPVYGYSISGPQPCLVYQYMSGGCLEQRLRSRDPQKQLKWNTRLNISKGVARGLQYLHTTGEKPLIHGDIKSANILLDLNDEPRIGDFGLAREGPHSDYTHMKVSRIHGTRPYLPDEFLRAKTISPKVDTYSFGVVMFEITTGLSAYSENRQNKFLKDHIVNYSGDIVELKDVRAGSENEHFFFKLIDVGKICVSKKPRDRPDMKSVYIELEQVK